MTGKKPVKIVGQVETHLVVWPLASERLRRRENPHATEQFKHKIPFPEIFLLIKWSHVCVPIVSTQKRVKHRNPANGAPRIFLLLQKNWSVHRLVAEGPLNCQLGFC